MKSTLLLTVLLISCGPNGIDCLDGCSKERVTVTSPTNSSCSTKAIEEGAVITCPDGSQTVISNGKDGINGDSGNDGVDGKDGSNGKDGQDGANGTDGKDGVDGKDGKSCTVTRASNGAIIECGKTSVIVYDGKAGIDGIDGHDGVDGEDGTDGKNGANGVLEFIDPCGDDPDEFDEVIVRTTDDKLLAFLEFKGARHLVLLSPGSYRTTDKQKCDFTVTTGLGVEW